MEHAAHAPAWAVALEASGLGLFMRQSALAYPAANLSHLLGLCLLIGPIALFDLRMLGLGRSVVSPADARRALIPVAVLGLLVLAPSGALMFAADARSLASSEIVLWKLSLAALGVANALLFHALWRARVVGWDADAPVFGRLQALASLGLWLTVAALGRLIAYF